MFKDLTSISVKHFLLIAGVFFIFFSIFTIDDITKAKISYSQNIHILPFIIGTIFVVVSLAWYAELSLFMSPSLKVKKIKTGYLTKISHAEITIIFGQIQEECFKNHEAMFVLPVNDLFDDDCIFDKRSAIGAFVNKLFPNNIDNICKLIHEKIRDIPPIGRNLNEAPRYRIGDSVYLDKPLSCNERMAFIAVTKFHDKEGIKCEAANIFTVIKKIHKIMNDNRIDTIIVPILGSGHGGLRPSISFLCMLIALAECIREPSGRHIKKVKIIIFKKDTNSKPVISEKMVQKFLTFAQGYC